MSEASTVQYNYTTFMANVTGAATEVVYNETMYMANITNAAKEAVSRWKWDFIAISPYKITIWFFGSMGNLFSLVLFLRKGFDHL